MNRKLFGICRRLFETSKQLFEVSRDSHTQPEQTKQHSDTHSHAARTDKVTLRHAFTRGQNRQSHTQTRVHAQTEQTKHSDTQPEQSHTQTGVHTQPEPDSVGAPCLAW